MKKFIHFLISITVFIQIFPVFVSADTTYNEPNDPFFKWQWYYSAVKASAYRNNGIDGHGVKAGIIDTGLKKDLQNFYDFDDIDIQTGINVCAILDNNKDLLYDIDDNDGHGTNVTNIICAKSDNEYGTVGLTDNCTIIPYSAADDNMFLILMAIDLAYRNGCDVVNISSGSKDIGDYNIDLYNKLIDKATQNGMIIIAGTGNDGKAENNLCYPAACNNVIGVGAVEPIPEATKEDIKFTNTSGTSIWTQDSIACLKNNDYVKCSFSTANESIFVSAPGNNIIAPRIKNREKQEWTVILGTSFATPIVASAAIGAKQMRPYIDVDMFKEILIATSTDLDEEGYDINTGYGMVNFEKIYEYVSQMPLTAPERTPNVQVDFANGKLTNFCPNREYTVNGVSIGTPEYDDSILGIDKNIGGNMDIPEEWYGTTIEIVKKASSDAYTDSEPQYLEIPALPELPTIGELTIDYAKERIRGLDYLNEYTVNGEDVTLYNGTDSSNIEIAEDWFGTTITIAIKDTDIIKEIEIPAKPEVTGLSGDKSMIIGTTANMQYRKQGSTTWRNCSDGSTRVSFSSGTAEVYIKATDTAFKSDITTIQVGAVATPEPTTAPTAIPEATATPTIAPTVEPTTEPTSSPNVDITPTPTANPTIEPTETPVFSFLPTIDYENKRIIGLDSTQEYTVNGRDISLFTYSTGETGFDIDELWYGETITLAVKGTNEVRQITVQFTEKEQYELETNIEYSSETGECIYSAVNNTIWTINTTGIIAVYSHNGVLKHIETVTDIPVAGISQTLDFALSDGDTVKWLVWDSLNGMKPMDKVKLDEYVVK